MIVTERDRVVAALTVMGEATPGDDADRLAVACVILNRAANPRWWGGPSLASVCLFLARGSRWHQFSCWNEEERHAKRFRQFTTEDGWRGAHAIADLAPFLAAVDRAIAGERPRPGFGATHYALKSWIQRGAVSWARSRSVARATVIGLHAYFEPHALDIPEQRIVPYAPPTGPVLAPLPPPHGAAPIDAPLPPRRPDAPEGGAARPWWRALLDLILTFFGGRRD